MFRWRFLVERSLSVEFRKRNFFVSVNSRNEVLLDKGRFDVGRDRSQVDAIIKQEAYYKKFYFADSPLAMKILPNKGRFVVAERDMFQDEVILKARPYVHVVLANRLNAVCASCHTPLETVEGLPQMKSQMGLNHFCSQSCLQDMEKIIQTENKALKRLKFANQRTTDDFYDCILVIRMAVRRYLESRNRLNHLSDGLSSQHATQLISNTEAMKHKDAKHYFQNVRLGETISKSLDEHLRLPVTELLDMLNAVDFNSFSVDLSKEKRMECAKQNPTNDKENENEKEKENQKEEDEECSGYGLFPTASFFNHSCNPTCRFSFKGKPLELIIQTERDIAVGEELTISYCSVSTMKRCVKDIQDYYLFRCDCPGIEDFLKL